MAEASLFSGFATRLDVETPTDDGSESTRADLEDYVQTLRALQAEDGGAKVAFPANYDEVVAQMTRRDLESPVEEATEATEEAVPRPSRWAWARVALEEGVAAELSPALAAGRYESVLREHLPAADVLEAPEARERLLRGLATIEALDKQLQAKTRRARTVQQELEGFHAGAQENGARLDAVLREVRSTPGHHNPAATPSARAAAKDDALSDVASIPDSELYAPSSAGSPRGPLGNRTFITAVRDPASRAGSAASSPRSATSSHQTSGRSRGSRAGGKDFVRANAELAKKGEKFTDDEAQRLETLLGDEDALGLVRDAPADAGVKFLPDATLESRLREIDAVLLQVNFGDASGSDMERKVALGSLGLAALRSRGILLPEVLLRLPAHAFLSGDDEDFDKAEALQKGTEARNKEGRGAAGGRLKPPRAVAPKATAAVAGTAAGTAAGTGAATPSADPKQQGRQHLAQVKAQRAQTNALRILDKAIALVASATRDCSTPRSDSASRASTALSHSSRASSKRPGRTLEEGLLREISPEEIQAVARDAARRLRQEASATPRPESDGAVELGKEVSPAAAGRGRPSNLAPWDRIRALVQPHMSRATPEATSPETEACMPHGAFQQIRALTQETQRVRQEISEALQALSGEADGGDGDADPELAVPVAAVATTVAEIGRPAPSPTASPLSIGPLAGDGASAVWDLRQGGASPVRETASAPPAPATAQEAPTFPAAPAVEDPALRLAGLTLEERRWLRQSDRARRRRLHEIESHATIHALEDSIQRRAGGTGAQGLLAKADALLGRDRSPPRALWVAEDVMDGDEEEGVEGEGVAETKGREPSEDSSDGHREDVIIEGRACAAGLEVPELGVEEEVEVMQCTRVESGAAHGPRRDGEDGGNGGNAENHRPTSTTLEDGAPSTDSSPEGMRTMSSAIF